MNINLTGKHSYHQLDEASTRAWSYHYDHNVADVFMSNAFF